jgi:hypothetical protein
VIDSRFVLCGLALALPMCGGGMPEPAAAPTKAPATAAPPPASPGYPAGAVAPAPADASSVAPEAPPSPAAPAAESITQEFTRRVPVAEARSELARAEAALEASANDCAAACRALASMSRAVDHLCALVSSPDDQRRCDDAKRRMASARERVRQTCGACSP